MAAVGWVEGAAFHLHALERFETLEAWAAWLVLQAMQAPSGPAATPVVGGFDLPFGLPRELVAALGWPPDWAACMDHYAAQSRPQIRDFFKAFCDARPAGAKFAHRACDGPAGSSPSMKWVNPPVAWMLHAGVPRLRAAGWWLPAHEAAPVRRRHAVALEAYPGLLARELAGASSYKADDRARQTPERAARRDLIVQRLQAGDGRLQVRAVLTRAQADALVADASGDALDAVLCAVQAAWAAGQPGYGMPPTLDRLEGWIVSA